MRDSGQKRNTVLFVGFLLLAGVLHMLSRTGNTLWDTLLRSSSTLIYIGLLLFWTESVHTRLLMSGTRTGIIWVAVMMVSYLLLRTVKYDHMVSTVEMRYAVYAYWTPQCLIPALFLMNCIRIWRGGSVEGKQNEALLLIPACLLALVPLTNDLHGLVYRPTVPLSEFKVASGTYGYGPFFWILSAWMILTGAAGVVLLLRVVGKRSKQTYPTLTGLLLLWIGLILLNLLVLERSASGFRLFGNPEIHIFCMLGFLEICIRSRLIPYNENYPDFFRRLRIPALITDPQLQPVYPSEEVPDADRESLQAALHAPLALTPDRTLTVREVFGGYVFWVTDESAVHQAQERLLEANALIEQENDLIRAETEQRERDAYLQSRHRIYHEIAEKLYPCQTRIENLLAQAEPGTLDFRNKIARVCVLNAYVKRKTNLLLLSSEQSLISSNELYLALQESANYLTLAGLQTVAAKPEEKQLPTALILSLYDGFERLAEQILGQASSMMVSWHSDGLCLASQTDAVPRTDGIALPVRFRRVEHTLYMDLLSGKGGAEA